MKVYNYNLYWIHLPEHMDIFTEGYVGITIDPIRRFREHRNRGNQHLKNALNKYGDRIMFDIIIENHTVEYCKQIEEELRSEDNIGWNRVKGGGIPPNSKGKKFKQKNPRGNGYNWYNNGTEQTCAKACPQGWFTGGLKREARWNFTEEEKLITYAPRLEKRKGNKWFNNGVKEILTKQCPEDWSIGRIKNN